MANRKPKTIPRIPNGRLVPARIRCKGKTYSGKVKRVNGRVRIFVTPQVARKINPGAIHEYLVIFHNKNATKGTSMYITASTAGQASREAKKRKKSLPDARNWKVFSVKRLSK